MSMLFRTVALTGALFVAAAFANAASEKTAIRIKVLDAETHTVSVAGSDVPKNCDQVNFDAYCNNSKTTVVTNTLLVKEINGNAFRVACTVESKWSRCVSLPKGETFNARKGKRGVTVDYVDEKGKTRSQLYTLVEDGKANPQVATAAVAAPPASPDRAADSATAGAQAGPEEKAKGTVTCNFTSTPAGAEIKLDGRYVGSTPSEISVPAGVHAVALSMAGFTQWTRDLTVLPGSALTVNAILQKQAQ